MLACMLLCAQEHGVKEIYTPPKHSIVEYKLYLLWCSPFRTYCWQVWSHFCPTSNKQPSPSLATNSDTKSSSPCTMITRICNYKYFYKIMNTWIDNYAISLQSECSLSNVTYREMLVENITLANLVIVLLICLSFPIQILSVH